MPFHGMYFASFLKIFYEKTWKNCVVNFLNVKTSESIWKGTIACIMNHHTNNFIKILHGCMLICFCHIVLKDTPLNCSLPGFSVHGILQARILEWVAMPFRDIPDTRIKLMSLCLLGRQILYQLIPPCCCCLVAKSLEDSLWPNGLQYARLSCPLLSPRVCSNSCHPAI